MWNWRPGRGLCKFSKYLNEIEIEIGMDYDVTISRGYVIDAFLPKSLTWRDSTLCHYSIRYFPFIGNSTTAPTNASGVDPQSALQVGGKHTGGALCVWGPTEIFTHFGELEGVFPFLFLPAFRILVFRDSIGHDLCRRSRFQNRWWWAEFDLAEYILVGYLQREGRRHRRRSVLANVEYLGWDPCEGRGEFGGSGGERYVKQITVSSFLSSNIWLVFQQSLHGLKHWTE